NRTMYWILAFGSVGDAALYAERSFPICVGEAFARLIVAVRLVLVLLIEAPSRSSEGRFVPAAVFGHVASPGASETVWLGTLTLMLEVLVSDGPVICFENSTKGLFFV